jgi:hypothetical protein
MSRARRRSRLLIPIALVLIGFAIFAWSRGGDELGPRAERPVLLFLTSLPVMFGDELSLEAAGSPLLDALETRYRVLAIATTSPGELRRGHLLLMAQPLAQPAENLVALDQWVRDGGRVLLLADPLLEWADHRPLGDSTRPPPMFSDTGLLDHWGLTLDTPDTRGEQRSSLAGEAVTTLSPGRLEGKCDLSADRLVARCRIGKGEAMVVADADFLDWNRAGGAGGNHHAVLAALNSLESARSD